jgi:2-dehydropantoate 2-reductase
MSIHILGTGAIGCHMGAMLKAHKNKVTLLLRSQAHVDDFKARQNSITYKAQGQTSVIPGFDAHLIGSHNEQPIESLIVATKAHHTTKALKAMAPRLSSDTTILLLQNGMGVAEEIVDTLWPHAKPPQIFVGVNRHAVERTGPYAICHHSGYHDPDALRVGLFPLDNSQPTDLKGRSTHLIKEILAIPELHAEELLWKDLRVKMYKKLVINACINTLASTLMTKNRANIYNGNPAGIAIMRSVCEEFYEVFRDGLPGETVDSLMDMVLEINDQAGENICSTLQDIRAKRLTEIDYINGYVCKKGQEQNINVKTNQFFVNLMHAKEALYDF